MTEATVQRAHPDDWELFRAARLAALADAPSAFWTTLADASALTEAEWRQRLRDAGCFVAVAGGRAVGLAAGLREADGTAELISMWVDAAWRGRGVSDRLVDAVAGWAAADGLGRLQLWVADGNTVAERLYARHRFVRTGVVQLMHPDDPTRMEFQMIREAAGGGG